MACVCIKAFPSGLPALLAKFILPALFSKINIDRGHTVCNPQILISKTFDLLTQMTTSAEILTKSLQLL